MKRKKTIGRLGVKTEYIYTEEAKAKDLEILSKIKSMAEEKWIEFPDTPVRNRIGDNEVLISNVFGEQLEVLTIRNLTLEQVTAIFEVLKKGK